MAKSEKQKQKLFRLLQIFIERTDPSHGVSMNELIAGLDGYGITAERKSIYDDISVLEELGFEIKKLPTRPITYTLKKRIFEIAELKLLVDAIQASKFITEEDSKKLIAKLKSFAGDWGSGQLARQVWVEGRAKTVNTDTIKTIDTIHNAINGSKQIKFKYFRYNGEKKKVYGHESNYYRVSPISLIWSEQNYYLVAYDEEREDMRNYRVDRMQAVSELEEKRSKAASGKRIDSAEYSQKIFGMYGGKETLVTLECDEKLATVIIDRFGTKPTFFKCDGGFRVSVKVMISPNFYAWVMGFGNEMKIIKPDEVREGMVEKLKLILDSYE